MMKRIIVLYLASMLLAINSLSAASVCGKNRDHAVKVMETDSTTVVIPFYNTNEHEGKVMFQSRRIDRGVNKGKFVFKGEYIGGVSASYLTLDGDNTEIFLLINDIEASGSMVSVKPYMAYFYRDNRGVGVRFGYTSMRGQIDSATIDLGEANDISFDVPYVMYDSHAYSYGLFHRSYTALDRKGNFALFADIEMEFSQGKSIFEFSSGGDIMSYESHNNSYELSLNPGLSVFMFHNMSASVSFQFGGLSYTRIRQYDENGDYVGSRDASQMKFMFNVFAIKFGMNFHIW